jgi:hypothetical protein
MRHLSSLLLGIVAAPLTWVLVAAGQDGSATTIDSWVKADSNTWANLLEPAVYLAVAGLLLGLVGTPRISPVGPLAAGLLLITPYAGMFIAPFAVRDMVPTGWKLLGDPMPLRLPLENGTLLLIGALLMMATFSVQRWRRWPDGEPPTGVTSDPATTNWSALGSGAPDTTAPSLGYPEPAGKGGVLSRRGTGMPWVTPRAGRQATAG